MPTILRALSEDSKAARDAKLAKLSAELTEYAGKRKIALEAEAAWIEALLTRIGGSVPASLEEREKLGVADSISEFLK